MKFSVYIFLFLFSHALVAQKQLDTIQASYIGGVKDLVVFLHKNLKNTKSFPDSKNPDLSGKMIVALIKLDDKNRVNDVDYANLENHYQGNTVDLSFKDELENILKKSNKWKSKSFQGKIYSSKMIYIFKFWNDSIDITPYPLKYEGEYFDPNLGVTMEKESKNEDFFGNGNVVMTENNNSNSVTVVEEKQPNEVFALVEEMPVYLGGNENLKNDILKSISYNKSNKDFSGNYILKFIVDKEGNIIKPEILKGIKDCSSCDAAILDVFKKIKKFKPGKQNGRTVDVFLNIMVKFEKTK